eukprot:TRINITY_DN115_c0_g1_i1.p1 TRINITY_DN115_c0_g1~~TRINITY_DN115_c0_g1_i1.p1  ORF type:complete len:1016 (-),score=473.03 TRINITY_DN115_c0_g1_i1:156-3203(-)
MPRFFQAEDDFYSDESDASDSEEEEVEDDEAELLANQRASAARHARMYFSSSDEDDFSKNVVRTAKEKRFEEMSKSIKSLNNYSKIKDFIKISQEFDNLLNLLKKAAKIIKDHGDVVPRPVIKCFTEIEDLVEVQAKNKKECKKMSKTNYKALNAMKQKLRKNLQKYSKLIKLYRQNPDVEEEKVEVEDETALRSDDDEEEEEEEKEEEERTVRGRSYWLKKPEEDDESSDDDDDDDFLNDDEDDADVEDNAKASKWLKAGGGGKGKKVGKGNKNTFEVDEWATGGKGSDWSVASINKEEEEKRLKAEEEKKAKEEKWDQARVEKELLALVATRGKKGYDKYGQIGKFTDLLDKARTLEEGKSVAQEIGILAHLISAIFDMTSNADTHLPVLKWHQAYENLALVLSLLEANPTIILASEQEYDQRHEKEKDLTFVVADILGLFEKLDAEFTKSLQKIDPHTQDYIHRLQDEQMLLVFAFGCKKYYTRIAKVSHCATLSLRIVQHLYFKLDRDYVKQLSLSMKTSDNVEDLEDEDEDDEDEEAEEEEEEDKVEEDVKGLTKAEQKARRNAVPVPTMSSDEAAEKAEAAAADCEGEVLTATQLISKLSAYVYDNGDAKLRTPVLLCQIYHHSIHDRFFQARDLMLMSHLQDSIMQVDIGTQILFNRTMAQLGLCAFRGGLVSEAHGCLNELYSGGRVKELLAQGMTSRYNNDKTSEQEKLERRRQVPFHQHINLELLECVHLVCAMILEVPHMASNNYDSRRRVISRQFRRQLDIYDRQVFNGPPENTRERVIKAARYLMKGNWSKCCRLVLELQCWNLLPNPTNVQEMVKRKIQLAGVRTFLFTYATYYDSISLEELSKLFELGKDEVHSEVSKMIIHEELQASWDQPSSAIVLSNPDPNRVQTLGLQLADKLTTYFEQSDRLANLFGKGNTGGGDDRGGRDGGYRGGYKNNWEDRGGDNRRNQGGNRSQGGGNRSQGGGGGGNRNYGGNNRNQGGNNRRQQYGNNNNRNNNNRRY